MRLHRKLVPALVLMAMLIGPFAAAQPVWSAPPPQQLAVPILVVNTSFLNIRTGPGAEFTVLATVVGGTELPVLGVARDGVWYLVGTGVGNGWVNVEFTLARGNFERVPLVEGPDPDETPFETPVLPTTGIILPAASAAAAPGGAVSGTTLTGVFRGYLNVDATNVLSAPDTSAPAITVLLRNDAQDYAIVDRRSNDGIHWLAIVIPGVGTGWVEETRLNTRLARLTNRDVLVVNVDVVALTPSPAGGDGPLLSRGQEGYLVGISADGLAYQLQLPDGRVGWVTAGALIGRSGTTTDTAPLQATTTTGVAFAGGATGTVSVPVPQLALEVPVVVVNTSFQNVRSGPGAQYTTVATLRGGTTLPVIGRTEDGVWLLVRGDFGDGWLASEFVLFRGAYDNVAVVRDFVGRIEAPIVVIASGPIPLYAAPGTNYSQVTSISGPVELPVVAITSDGAWVQVNTSAGFGWFLVEQVIIRGNLNLVPSI